ncbi:MAG: HesA/MoeB/ThiF family protein [Candidatus Glassbacteria bacterium]|nr:HesA/MoeB/ThiF family protein [Candidatus Glassbacteria bacterium]
MEFVFSDEQIERFSRHIILQEVGGEGQRKLLESSALVIGAGGLGSPVLMYLSAAGIGRLGVVDGDTVELSNLQRQIIHGTDDLGRNKTVSAKEVIAGINPDCKIEAIPERLNVENAKDIISGYDVVLDGCDNFPTRFLVADCCFFENIPLVSAASLRFEGQLLTILPGEGNPCYRCMIPEPPPPGLVPNCQEAGILGAVVGAMGTLQAVEALKLLLGIGQLFSHKMMVYDALEGSFTILKRVPDPACPLCGKHPGITSLVQYDTDCSIVSPESA